MRSIIKTSTAVLLALVVANSALGVNTASAATLHGGGFPGGRFHGGGHWHGGGFGGGFGAGAALGLFGLAAGLMLEANSENANSCVVYRRFTDSNGNDLGQRAINVC
jgi:hypothetical protein